MTISCQSGTGGLGSSLPLRNMLKRKRPTIDFLDFLGILYPPNFGCWVEDGVFQQRRPLHSPMAVLVQGLKLDGTPGPFQSFADAVELAKAGKTEEAKTKIAQHSGSSKFGDAHTAMGLVSFARTREAAECQLTQGDSRCSHRGTHARSV
jgi:hypothetical protein